MSTINKQAISKLKREFNQELQSITNWWCTNGPDVENGGFIGEISSNGQRIYDAPKSIILNTRILWFFSEVALFNACEQSRAMADRAYDYLLTHFDDTDQGGVIWSVDCYGDLLDGKKQTYAQSFAIYALSSYFALTGKQAAIDKALTYFDLLELHTHDNDRGGYLEAFSQDWQEIEDMRLSEKDANLPKTMNTHLHVLEAYTNLQKYYPTTKVNNALSRLIDYFQGSIVDHSNYHLRLFMCRNWGDHSQAYSYGHDIECSWLLHKSLKALKDPKMTVKVLPTVIKLAHVCLAEGIGDKGQVLDEIDIKTGKQHTESCWWIQAEALVGFLNAYTLTGEDEYFSAIDKIWSFTQQYHIDKEQGEWHWLATCDQDKNDDIYKAGFWKGPYHNGRALMEALKLLEEIDV
ncbi:AGE family epimerase/isomerase [Algibacillus agarilyticus]|uniref:AGE family epimerase/isomerase n=1 Tax=Algibacillus agarilyticus TaxID=2234133 RepID=UPI000DCFBA30|nr:AGE family epimerase/isomerase [Algibacillus agarilyticus]